MNVKLKQEQRTQEIYDELLEFISGAPYELGIADETIWTAAESQAESEVDDYFDSKYEQLKDERMEREFDEEDR